MQQIPSQSDQSPSDASLLRGFEDHTLPYPQWTHQAHVRVAYMCAAEHALEEAIHRMRVGIQSYNATNNIAEGPHQGYHETTTQAFMRLIQQAIQVGGPFQDTNQFCVRNPNLMDRRVLMCYYTRDRIMEPNAKTSFVPPDIAPLNQIGLAFLEFGRREGIDYMLRPGGYGVIADNVQRIAVVRTPQGTFLPGGGQEAGESAINALHREVLEECGLTIRIHLPIGVADEFVFATKKNQPYCKRCTFYSAEVVGRGQPSEADHQLVWLTFEETVSQLTDGSQRWAVLAYQRNPLLKVRE